MLADALLLAGVWLDLVSAYRWMRRSATGRGSGGVPVAAWLIYLGVCVAQGRWLLLVLLTALHVACHLLVPGWHRRWLAGQGSPKRLPL